MATSALNQSHATWDHDVETILTPLPWGGYLVFCFAQHWSTW